MTESKVGNRLVCKCGGERFFIQAEADEPAFEAAIDTVECVVCHTIYRLTVPAS